MLTLAPPFYQEDGIFLARDHADPYTFYYMPDHPQIATVNGKPAFRFFKYRADLDDFEADANAPTGGGFLVCDVDLGFEPDRIKRIARKLQAHLQLDRLPNLVPPQWESGTVQFMLLGRASELPTDDAADTDDTDDATPADETWVTSFLAHGVPSLYGDNRAIFQASVTKAAATLIEKSFDADAILPIGVVYSLKFLALRPAFKVRIEANWQDVYEHFSESWGADLLVFSLDISKAVDTLVDQRVIQIHTEVTDPDAEATAKQALEELKSLVLEKFFEPRLKPSDAAEARDHGDVGDFVRGVRRALHPGVGYSRKEIKQTELHHYSAEWSMARAVERSVVPQAHLSPMLSEAQLRKDDVIEEIDLDDPFFDTFRLTVAPLTGWAEQGIERIAASVRYGDKQRDLDFDTEAKRYALEFNFDDQAGYGYAYDWRVLFRHDAPEGPTEFRLPVTAQRGGPLILNPQTLWKARTVRVVASATLPFDDFGTVEVDLRYVWPTGRVSHETVLLKAGEAADQDGMRLRLQHDWTDEIEYRVTYHRSGQAPIVLPWQATDESVIHVGDPRGQKTQVRVMVADRHAELLSVSVDLQYTQPDGSLSVGNVYFEGEKLRSASVWSVHFGDPARRHYRYQVTIMTLDGQLFETPWRESDRLTLAVGRRQALLMPIKVEFEPDDPDFEAAGVERVTAHLTYHDPQSDLRREKTLAFESADRAHVWTVHRARVEADAFEYTLTYRLDTGFEHTVGPLTHTGEHLRLRTRPQP